MRVFYVQFDFQPTKYYAVFWLASQCHSDPYNIYKLPYNIQLHLHNHHTQNKYRLLHANYDNIELHNLANVVFTDIHIKNTLRTIEGNDENEIIITRHSQFHFVINLT